MSTLSIALQTRTFRSLRRHHNYRLFFGGQIVSLAGSWMQNVLTSQGTLVRSQSRPPLFQGFAEIRASVLARS
jgi:hypothetical protein